MTAVNLKRMAQHLRPRRLKKPLVFWKNCVQGVVSMSTGTLI